MRLRSLKYGLIGLFLLFLGNTYADQLQWLSKTDAERAAKYIKKQGKVFLFCGCCDGEHYRKIRPYSTAVKQVENSDKYEVIVTWYTAKNGAPLSEPVDLAYVWVRKKKNWYTVGQILRLEHDPCKLPVK